MQWCDGKEFQKILPSDKKSIYHKCIFFRQVMKKNTRTNNVMPFQLRLQWT